MAAAESPSAHNLAFTVERREISTEPGLFISRRWPYGIAWNPSAGMAWNLFELGRVE
jgi:hypothetical protein